MTDAEQRLAAKRFAESYVYDMKRPGGEPEKILLADLEKEYICSCLSDSSSFWEHKGDNHRQSWFDFYGDYLYDNSVEYIL